MIGWSGVIGDGVDLLARGDYPPTLPVLCTFTGSYRQVCLPDREADVFRLLKLEHRASGKMGHYSDNETLALCRMYAELRALFTRSSLRVLADGGAMLPTAAYHGIRYSVRVFPPSRGAR